MASQNELKIKLTLLADGLKQGLANAKKSLDDLKNAGAGAGDKAAADANRNLGSISGTVNRVSTDIKSSIAGAFAFGAVVMFTNKLIEAIRVVQDLRTRLSGLTNSAQDYAASEAYLVDLAERHHKAINVLTGSYASFLSLEKAGIITRQQAIQLLEGFSNAMTKTGATQDQMAMSVYGLAQALGTGIVAMEEFKQITEPMPGLANEIAKSFGVTVGQLRVMIGTGTLTSELFGKHMVQALQAYEGAAARAGGTISASYADIGNSYTAMAKELEKPIATAVLSIVDVGKSAYGWLKDNGDAIVQTLTLIAVTMVGKSASALAAYTKAGIQSIQVEQAHTAAIIENEQRTVAARAAKVAAAEAKLAERTATAELAAAELVLANATLQQARANELASGSAAMLVDAELAQIAATERLAAAARSKGAADAFLIGQNEKLAASQLALTTATNASGVAMTRLGAAAKSAMAFVGGPVGVAVIALYGLYEVLNKVTDAEGKAEAKAKLFADNLGLVNEKIKEMSSYQVKLGLDEAKKDTDELNAKIAKLEEFNFENVANLWGNASKRQALLDDLELTGKKIDALNQKDIELIKNFDATSVPVNELKAALTDTQLNIEQLANHAEQLKIKLHSGAKLSLYETKQLNDDELRLNAYESKQSAIQKQIEVNTNTSQDAVTKKSIAAEKAKLKAVEDGIKEIGTVIDAENARQNEALKASLAQRKADIAAMGISELEKELLVTQAIKASNDAQLLIIQQASKGKIAAIDEVFNAEIANAKEGSSARNLLDKESLQAKLVVYNAQAKSYGSMINELIADEQKLAADSLKLAEQRKSIEQSYEDFKTGLLISSKKGWEKDIAERGQLDKLVADQKKAAAAGDVKAAEEYDARILELGKKLATAQQESINAGHGFQGQYDDIIKITDKAQAGLLAANQKAQDSNQQRLGELSASAYEAKAALGSVESVIEALNIQLQAKHSLKIDPDTQAVDEAIARISKPTSSTHTVNVVENRSPQAHATGGLITAYASGGEVFERKQGSISGKGTGTSDEVPAMLSNGEYVIKANVVQKHGVSAFDAINYNNAPVPKYAAGGLVGDDKLKQKVDELKKQAYEQAVAVFNTPRNQIIWRMNTGASSTGSEDPNNQEKNFEYNVGEYLKINKLPLEWREMYLKGVKAQQVLMRDTQNASFEDKAKAQLELDGQFAAPEADTKTSSTTSDTIPSPKLSAPPSVAMPSVTPANFSPTVSRSSPGVSGGVGKISTVKFVAPDNKSVTGTFAGDNAADFFSQLDTISGVTRV